MSAYHTKCRNVVTTCELGQFSSGSSVGTFYIWSTVKSMYNEANDGLALWWQTFLYKSHFSLGKKAHHHWDHSDLLELYQVSNTVDSVHKDDTELFCNFWTLPLWDDIISHFIELHCPSIFICHSAFYLTGFLFSDACTEESLLGWANLFPEITLPLGSFHRRLVSKVEV